MVEIRTRMSEINRQLNEMQMAGQNEETNAAGALCREYDQLEAQYSELEWTKSIDLEAAGWLG